MRNIPEDQVIELVDAYFDNVSSYNQDDIMTPEDFKSGTRILDQIKNDKDASALYFDYEMRSGIPLGTVKDLTVGTTYTVIAEQLVFKDGIIKTTEFNSKMEIIIPFNEYTGDVALLADPDNSKFEVILIESKMLGQFVGSEKQYRAVHDRDVLFDKYENNDWFDVKITKLIRGGYVATYNDNIECFIPGSQAGANRISDFSSLLDTTITVMVDNYDKYNNLFIVSYKKYIKHSMHLKVSDLRFGKRYDGILTNKPYDFGMFVEIDGYYTGLVHSSDFKNYSEIKRTYKSGQMIDVYIKNVTRKGKDFRIMLTVDPESIDESKKRWDDVKTNIEGESFPYDVDIENSKINIDIDGTKFSVVVDPDSLADNVVNYPLIKVSNVDIINQNMNFEFTK